MMNWIKNLFKSSTPAENYVVTEFQAVKKKRAKDIDPIASQFENTKNETGEYMNIDRLHQKN